MSLLVDLPADIGDLRDRLLVENVAEIIDVACGLKLGNWFCPHPDSERHNQGCSETQFPAQIHTQIVQDAPAKPEVAAPQAHFTLVI